MEKSKYSEVLINNMENDYLDRTSLIKYLLNQRENKIHLEKSNIIMTHDPKRFPYVHSIPNSAKDQEYFIESNDIDIDENHQITEYTYSQNSSPHLDLLVGVMVEVLAFNENFDPWLKNPKKPLNEKIEEFLYEHLGITYEEFVKDTNYKELTGEGFDCLGKNGIKKQLFDFRAKTYLTALAVAEEQGYDIKYSLEALAKTKIFPIKKFKEETVLEIIKQKLTV